MVFRDARRPARLSLLVLVPALTALASNACSSRESTSSMAFSDHGSMPPSAAPGGPRMTVMTYNLNFGMAGDEETIDVIRKANADVVFLQETNEQWERALVRELGAIYPHRRFHGPDGIVAGGVGLLSKHAFNERSKDLVPSPNGWFPGWRVVIDSPLGAMQVLDVHLRPPLTDKGAFLSGYFSTKPLRRAEIETYAKTLDPALPTLVVGDFNEDEGGSAVAFLEERGMKSALPAFEPSQRTWHWQTSLGEVGTRLDHVVYDEKSFVALDAHVIEAGRSDHFPVVVTLALASTRAPTPFVPAAPAASVGP